MSGNPPVVIIGAGVGGLTLALLLRRRGIVAEVLEQSTELREVGAAVGLAANATRVLQHLGLGEALAKVSTEPTGLIHRDGRDGHRIAATRGPQWYRDTFGAPFFGLHRAALQAATGMLEPGRPCCWATRRTRCFRTRGRVQTRPSRNAVVLAAELDSASDIPVALRRYARRRRVRTRQVQLASWAASAALHLPDGQAAQRRNAYLAQIPQHIAWIHSYDALAQDRDDLARTTGAR